MLAFFVNIFLYPNIYYRATIKIKMTRFLGLIPLYGNAETSHFFVFNYCCIVFFNASSI